MLESMKRRVLDSGPLFLENVCRLEWEPRVSWFVLVVVGLVEKFVECFSSKCSSHTMDKGTDFDFSRCKSWI